MKTAYFRGAVACILVYDISKLVTFENLDRWRQELRQYAEPNIVMMLVGNKSDLRHRRQIDTHEAMMYAENNNMGFIETSARDSIGVEEMLLGVMREAYRCIRPKPDGEAELLPLSSGQLCVTVPDVHAYAKSPSKYVTRLFEIQDIEKVNLHWQRVVWAEDSSQSNCFCCLQVYSMFKRRHHCRCCGNMICNDCSLYRLLPNIGYGKTRVCKYCTNDPETQIRVDRIRFGTNPIRHQFVSSLEGDAFYQKNLKLCLATDGVVLLSNHEHAPEYQGSFSMVYPCHGRNCCSVSIRKHLPCLVAKCYYKWFLETSSNFIIDEIRNLQRIQHPNVISIYASNIDINCNLPLFPYILFKRYPVGSLRAYLQRFSSDSSKEVKRRNDLQYLLCIRMILQIISALQHIHSMKNGIMHNNLHCGNILVVSEDISGTLSGSRPLVILTDFTSAKYISPSVSMLMPIPTHRAPEIWQNQQCSIPAEVFALGMCVAEIILVDNTLFSMNYDQGEMVGLIRANILEGKRPPVEIMPSIIDNKLASIARACWVHNPNHRPSLSSISSELSIIENAIDESRRLKSSSRVDGYFLEIISLDRKWEQLARWDNTKGSPDCLPTFSVGYTTGSQSTESTSFQGSLSVGLKWLGMAVGCEKNIENMKWEEKRYDVSQRIPSGVVYLVEQEVIEGVALRYKMIGAKKEKKFKIKTNNVCAYPSDGTQPLDLSVAAMELAA